MKRLQMPKAADVSNLRSIVQNSRLASYPHLLRFYRPILRNYLAYRNVTGNLEAENGPTEINMGNILADAIRSHFSRPPKAIQSFLELLRESGSPDVCPMCGSLGTGTLDHIFPQSDFPDLSLFSLNLVPACICNSKRQDHCQGNNPGERILHPYYDDILSHRLVRANIQPSTVQGFKRPYLRLEIILPRSDPNFAAVQYHIETVIFPTQVLAHLSVNWTKLVRGPEVYLSLPSGTVSDSMVATAIQTALDKKDRHFGSLNNWESMLFSGIIVNTAAITFLANQVNDFRSGVSNPQDF